MGGGSGREIPILISTAAIVGTGAIIANDKRTIPKSNFFILLSPLSIISIALSSRVFVVMAAAVMQPAALSSLEAEIIIYTKAQDRKSVV
jgi:hypothetical protein